MDSSSPYCSHPIFAFRVALLADAAFGISFTIFTAFDGYISFHSLFALILMLFVLTIAICCYDFVEWAINKSRTTEFYQWPVKVVLLTDLVQASLFIVAYVKELIDLIRYLHWVGVGFIITYGTLPPLFAAILHGICVFQQLRRWLVGEYLYLSSIGQAGSGSKEKKRIFLLELDIHEANAPGDCIWQVDFDTMDSTACLDQPLLSRSSTLEAYVLMAMRGLLFSNKSGPFTTLA